MGMDNRKSYALWAEDLHVSYHLEQQCVEALRGVSIYAGPGEVIGITGKSGSGKTTLAGALSGLLPAGAVCCCKKVQIAGVDITDPVNGRRGRSFASGGDPFHMLLRDRIAVIMQNPQVCMDPSMTVQGQLAEAMRLCGKRPKKKDMAALLSSVGIADPASCMKKYPFELSGGMCQRILIAMAALKSPRVIIADEPTSALDRELGRQMLQLLIDTAKRSRSALLLISHDMDSLYACCQRVYHISQGKIAKMRQDAADRAPDAMSESAVKGGRDGGASGELLLSFDGVTKDYRRMKAHFFRHRRQIPEGVTAIELTLHAGENFGLTGPSGSGKTTIARLVAGLTSPDEGTICYMGDLAGYPAGKKGRIQMIFQDTYGSLNPALTIGHILSEAYRCHTGERSVSQQFLLEKLSEVGLPAFTLRKKPGELSGGERQRVCIAKALLSDPILLILDEPTASLDMDTAQKVVNLILDIQKRRGLTCLWISHDERLIGRICSRRGMLLDGYLKTDGGTERFDRNV